MTYTIKKRFQSLAVLTSVLLLAACAAGPCRKLREPELAAHSGKTPKVESPQSSTPSASPMTKEATVLVYKPDGSLQCGMGKGLSVEEMEKQLSGIKVFSRDKRSDGLMHIQVCGSATGMINVYEIPASSLKDAESKGFKKLERV